MPRNYEQEFQRRERLVAVTHHEFYAAYERVEAARRHLAWLSRMMKSAQALDNFAQGTVDFERVGLAIQRHFDEGI